MSLDPGLLNFEQDKTENNKLQENSETKRRWGTKRQMTFDQSHVIIHHTDDNKLQEGHVAAMKYSPEPCVVKSSSTEQRMSSALRSGLSTPFSTSDANVDLLGVSFINPSKSVQNLNITANHRRVMDENDLSTPYNHYRCLSPSDSKHPQLRTGNASRFLKRQFSVDREDVTSSDSTKAIPVSGARLFKQNSAGAAHDLERIEEIPSKHSTKSNCYKHRFELPPCTSLSDSISSIE